MATDDQIRAAGFLYDNPRKLWANLIVNLQRMHSLVTKLFNFCPRLICCLQVAHPWPKRFAVELRPTKKDTRPGNFAALDRKSTRLNSSHLGISYAVFCLKKKN